MPRVGDSTIRNNLLRHLLAAGMPEVPQQRGSAPTSRPGLQSGQLHADFGLAEGGGTLVADDATGEAGEDRREGGQSRAVRHVPIGRSGGAERIVPENPEPD